MTKPGTQKLKTWQPQPVPNQELCKKLRQYVVETVFKKWAKDEKPATLISIYFSVHDRIGKERQIGVWPREWKQPGKRTVDRRVNEAADPRFYENGVPKIVAVTAGVYQPNPILFEGEQNEPST